MKKAKLPPRSQGQISAKTEDMVEVSMQSFVHQQDPMKISLVLERIFSFCSVEILKQCRLVSTQWRDESLKAWRNKAVLTLWLDEDYGENQLEKYLQRLKSDEDDVDAPFRNLKKYPYKRFEFGCCNREQFNAFSKSALLQPIANIARFVKIYRYEFESNDKHEDLREFLSEFQSLEVIQFQDCYDTGNLRPNFNLNEENLLSFKMPRVKQIKISQESDGIEEAFWESVLKWFPNLDSLFLEYKNIDHLECLDNLKSILNFLERAGGGEVIPLKELEMSYIPKPGWKVDIDEDENSEAIIRSLVQCNFPLERLATSFQWNQIDRLLESFKNTLQYLKTSFSFPLYWDRRPQNLKMKRNIIMEKLKQASLGNGYHRALALLTHLELPTIEKLTIVKDENHWEENLISVNYIWKFPRGRVYKMLKTLEFLDNRSTPDPHTIKTFGNIMPNLVHLTIPLDRRSFPIVCERFRGLKTLNTLGAQCRHEELDDESLTGISRENEEWERGLRRPPNITDLSLLTDITISCESQLLGDDVKFTDHSVIHGFLLLPRLYSLSIAFQDLSEDVKAKLMSHVKGKVCFQEVSPIVDECYACIDGGESDGDTDDDSSGGKSEKGESDSEEEVRFDESEDGEIESAEEVFGNEDGED